MVTLTEIETVAAKYQPELKATKVGEFILLSGIFVVSAPEGPYDSFNVEIHVLPSFPFHEPKVFEVGNRIPKVADRHVYPNVGNCCLCVWEEWLLCSPKHSFEAFLTGVLHDYFVGQTCFEAKGEWPFGERSHGVLGILESYADILCLNTNNIEIIAEHLTVLSRDELKGHCFCPCGSGKRLRNCHLDRIKELKERIQPNMAKRMLGQIKVKSKGKPA